jgi:hypothetical protein
VCSKLFIGGISRDTREDEFLQIFGQFGQIADAVRSIHTAYTHDQSISSVVMIFTFAYAFSGDYA